jgi:putative ABC transport system permease protein
LAWTLVTAQLVQTLILLVGAGAMMRRTVEAGKVDAAINTQDVLTLRIQLPEVDYRSAGERAAFIGRLESVLAEDPAIDRFAISDGLPVSPGGRTMHLHDHDGPSSSTFPVTSIAISPGYFATFRLPLLRGRDFVTGDDRAGVTPVIVNRRLADRYFPGQDPVGRSIGLSDSPSDQPAAMTIVGVSPQIRQGFDSSIEPVIYLPYRVQPSPGVSLLVRSPAPPAVLLSRIRGHVQRLDPDLPVFDVLRMDQVVRRMVWLGRIVGGMFAIFAAMALALSVVGLYGVVSYGVSERTREIGVRMALGADRGQVLQLVLGRTVAHLAVGLALGIGGVFLVAPLLRGILVGDYATDPTTVAIITALFTVASLLASYLPARRAMQQSPSVALRYE